MVLIYGLHGGVCLEGYSMRTFGELNESISRMPRFSEDRKALERIINTKALFTQVDETGRIVLPDRLREQIGAHRRGSTSPAWATGSRSGRRKASPPTRPGWPRTWRRRAARQDLLGRLDGEAGGDAS